MISAVSRARSRSDAALTSAEPTRCAAWNAGCRPRSGRGGPAGPCRRPSAFQVDWPWRTSSRRVIGRRYPTAPIVGETVGMSPVLTGDGVTLRPLTPDDADDLLRILGHPEVSRWW